VFAVLAVGAAILLARQSSMSDRATKQAPVANAAGREFKALDRHEWKDAWSLWSAAAQAVVTADDFARGSAGCGGVDAPAEPFGVLHVELLDADHARVATSGLFDAGGYDMVQENGQWRFVPPDSWLAEYREGVDAMIVRCTTPGS